MRKAGGVLTIIGGIMGIVLGIGGVEAFVTGGEIAGVVIDIGGVEAPLIAFVIVALIIGIVALISGIYALRARVLGFALAGGIVLIVNGAGLIGPWSIKTFREAPNGIYIGIVFMGIALIALGILGTIFIALRKREFE